MGSRRWGQGSHGIYMLPFHHIPHRVLYAGLWDPQGSLYQMLSHSSFLCLHNMVPPEGLQHDFHGHTLLMPVKSHTSSCVRPFLTLQHTLCLSPLWTGIPELRF